MHRGGEVEMEQRVDHPQAAAAWAIDAEQDLGRAYRQDPAGDRRIRRRRTERVDVHHETDM
jgi:hypothetical protein